MPRYRVEIKMKDGTTRAQEFDALTDIAADLVAQEFKAKHHQTPPKAVIAKVFTFDE